MTPEELKPIWRWDYLSFKRRSELPPTSGIYAVCAGKDIYYIGLASNLYNRWRGCKHHRYHVARLVPFSYLRYIEVPEPSLRNCENYLIQKLDPPWNYTPDPIDGYLGALWWHSRGHCHSKKPPIDWVKWFLYLAIGDMAYVCISVYL